MSRQYSSLTEISFAHDYYTSGQSDDFSLVATTETQKLIRSYRLMFGATVKGHTHTYAVLQEEVDGNPLLPLPTTYRMRFVMSLKNGNLLNYTDLPVLNRNEIFYFANSSGVPELQGGSLETMELVGNRFGLDVTASSVEARNMDTAESHVFTIPADAEVRIDLEGAQVGRYQIFLDGGMVADRTVYYDPKLAGTDIFGIIHLDQSGVLDIASAHTVDLSARQARWKYFLVLKGDHTGSTYAITDKSPGGTLTFSAPTTVPTYTLEAPDTTTEDLLGDLYPDAMVSTIVSDQSIPYREATRSLLTLERTLNAATSPVYANLPNPPAGNAHAAVIVDVESPSPI